MITLIFRLLDRHARCGYEETFRGGLGAGLVVGLGASLLIGLVVGLGMGLVAGLELGLAAGLGIVLISSLWAVVDVGLELGLGVGLGVSLGVFLGFSPTWVMLVTLGWLASVYGVVPVLGITLGVVAISEIVVHFPIQVLRKTGS